MSSSVHVLDPPSAAESRPGRPAGAGSPNGETVTGRGRQSGGPVPVPTYREIVALADLISSGALDGRQGVLVARLVEQLGFTLRVAFYGQGAQWKYLAGTYADCVGVLGDRRG